MTENNETYPYLLYILTKISFWCDWLSQCTSDSLADSHFLVWNMQQTRQFMNTLNKWLLYLFDMSLYAKMY